MKIFGVFTSLRLFTTTQNDLGNKTWRTLLKYLGSNASRWKHLQFY
jgi:hypothetical protein